MVSFVNFCMFTYINYEKKMEETLSKKGIILMETASIFICICVFLIGKCRTVGIYRRNGRENGDRHSCKMVADNRNIKTSQG